LGWQNNKAIMICSAGLMYWPGGKSTALDLIDFAFMTALLLMYIVD